MFTVINKDSKEIIDVYDITYNKSGYPIFLIYNDGQWIRMSAKHFRPYTDDDLGNKIGSYWLRNDNVRTETVPENGLFAV